VSEATQIKAAPTPMPVGGTVMAIVPQSFEEIQRVAVQVINAGIAPSSLVKFAANDATPEEVQAIGKRNVASVSSCIMAGAELGLPPMVSLRSFTVINGRPALYADGNVAVVRKARTDQGAHVAEYIKTGYTEVRDFICPVCAKSFAEFVGIKAHLILAHKEEYETLVRELEGPISTDVFELTAPTDKSHAWCEAKRADNGEIYRETFSIEDAKRAGLWEGDKPFKRAKVWRNNVQGWHDDVPNDAPWFRYWKRMLMWRAVGYCLRWLFADVLGGMADEYEAREIEGMIDITPAPRVTPASRPTPPSPPEPPEPKSTIISETSNEAAKDIVENTEPDPIAPPGQTGGGGSPQPAPAANTAADEDFNQDTSDVSTPTLNTEAYLARLDEELGGVDDEGSVNELFDAADVQINLVDQPEALERAFALRNRHLARVNGQGNLL
jgi:hypothetical protein